MPRRGGSATNAGRDTKARAGQPRRAQARRAKELLDALIARERDLKEVLEHIRVTNARMADAIVTVLGQADPQTLAGLGVILKFVVTQATTRRR